jgi:hypothetical protein
MSIDINRASVLARVGHESDGEYFGAHTRYIFDTAESLARVLEALMGGETPRPESVDDLRDRLRAARVDSGLDTFLSLVSEYNIRRLKYEKVMRKREKVRGRASRGRGEMERRLHHIDSVLSRYRTHPEALRILRTLIDALGKDFEIPPLIWIGGIGSQHM